MTRFKKTLQTDIEFSRALVQGGSTPRAVVHSVGFVLFIFARSSLLRSFLAQDSKLHGLERRVRSQLRCQSTCSRDKTALHSESDLLIVVIFLRCESAERGGRRLLISTVAGTRA